MPGFCRMGVALHGRHVGSGGFTRKLADEPEHVRPDSKGVWVRDACRDAWLRLKDESDDGARGEEQGCAKFEPTGSGRWENNSFRKIIQIPRICLPRFAKGRGCDLGTDSKSECNFWNEQEIVVLEGDVGEGKGYLLRVVCYVSAAVWGGGVEDRKKPVWSVAGVPPSESSTDVGGEKVASTQIPCVAENSREEVRSAADSAVCGREDATVRGARVPHGSGEAPAQNAVCVVSVSSYVRGTGSVPWIDDSRAFAVVRVAGGRPGVAKDCRRPEAMARCCWVPIKEAFVIKWPVCEVWDETGIY